MKFNRRSSGQLVTPSLVTLGFCSGCFLVDDFYIAAESTSAPSLVATMDVPGDMPAASESADRVPPSSSTGVLEPAPPQPSEVGTIPGVSTSAPGGTTPVPSESAAPSVPEPPVDVPDAGMPPSDSTSGDDDNPAGDDAGTAEQPEGTNSTAEMTEPMWGPPFDAGWGRPTFDGGSVASCDDAWSYDATLELCIPDCTTGEVRGPSGRCYWFGTQAATFNSAQTTCVARGTGWGMIAVKSAAEDEFIQEQLVADTWLGASDSQTPNTWLWLEDSSVFWVGTETGSAPAGAYAHWGNEEPSAANDERCARYHGSPGSWSWSDCACTEFFRPGCVGPAPVAPTYEGWDRGDMTDPSPGGPR